MGLPFLTVAVADNQKLIADGLFAAGISSHLGKAEELSIQGMCQEISRVILSPATRRQYSLLGKKLVDGEGVNRIVDYLKGSR